MDKLRTLGYDVGFYASQQWANNEFDAERLFNEGYLFWLANWFGNNQDLDPATLSWNKTAQPNLWQFRATGQVPGIEKETDMDYLYWKKE
jgi:GH25 family lysozyme M1 (1,4-beta-N-acetylmuramidase)